VVELKIVMFKSLCTWIAVYKGMHFSSFSDFFDFFSSFFFFFSHKSFILYTSCVLFISNEIELLVKFFY
jgi:hypothetical protein